MADTIPNHSSNLLRSKHTWSYVFSFRNYKETKYSVSSFMLSHWDGIPNQMTILSNVANIANGPPYTHT